MSVSSQPSTIVIVMVFQSEPLTNLAIHQSSLGRVDRAGRDVSNWRISHWVAKAT